MLGLWVGLVAVCGLAWLTVRAEPVNWLARSGFERPQDLDRFERLTAKDRIVYRRVRRIGEALVQRDFVAYHFDDKGRLLDFRVHWRDDLPETLPPVIDRQRLAAVVDGEVRYAGLFYLAPDCEVTPIDPLPKNPCWVVETLRSGRIEGVVVDAVEGRILGAAVPPPYEAVSFSGPINISECSSAWTSWYQNAADWFDRMGYPTQRVRYPGQATVQGHIQSYETALFYEMGHGGATSFTNGCSDATSAAEIANWLIDYPPMPFAFIGSCGGMCSTGPGTLSHAFRKGSEERTATVGYCGMADDPCKTDCWYGGYTVSWQERMFELLSQGRTLGEAFEGTNLDYPACAAGACFRLAGDENLTLTPKVRRRVDITIYVDASATGADDGSSWADAYRELRDAMAVTAPGDRIYVAQGVYRPASPGGDRGRSFHLPEGVQLLGGFPPGGGDEADRDPNRFETILCGDLNGDDGPDFANRGENAYHVIIAAGGDVGTVLDGVTIRRGNADAPYQIDTSGFAQAGGGMVVIGGGLSVIDCHFIENAARSDQTSWGGGVYASPGARPAFERCRFERNVAVVGAALYGTPGRLVDCLLEGNRAGRNGGGMYLVGGAGDLDISGCRFARNEADQDGGGVYMIDAGAGPRLLACIFEGNRAGRFGGAICGDEAGMRVDRSRFVSNQAPRGAAVYAIDVEATIGHGLFARNRAGDSGGAIHAVRGWLTLRQCTMAGNEASQTGGALAASGSRVDVMNCILWDDHAPAGAELWLGDGADMLSLYNNVAGGRGGLMAEDAASVQWGPGNIDVDPLFASAETDDYHLQSAAGRWDSTLSQWVLDAATSRCIDAGNPGTDLHEELVTIPGTSADHRNLRVNMGMYGGTTEAGLCPVGWALLSDMTNDGTTDLEDLAILTTYWQATGDDLPADMVRDRGVNLADLAVLAGDWLAVTPWH